jgi:hypothetical protein
MFHLLELCFGVAKQITSGGHRLILGGEFFGEVFLKELAGFGSYEAFEVELLDLFAIFLRNPFFSFMDLK